MRQARPPSESASLPQRPAAFVRILIVGGGGRSRRSAGPSAVTNPPLRSSATPGNPVPPRSPSNLRSRDRSSIVLAPMRRARDRSDRDRAGDAAGHGPGWTGSGPRAGRWSDQRPDPRSRRPRRTPKDLMVRAGVRRPRVGTFRRWDRHWPTSRPTGGQLVVKASGLAAGKGTAVQPSGGGGGRPILLGDRTFRRCGDSSWSSRSHGGRELSGARADQWYGSRTAPAAQDHKRIGERDTGPKHRRDGSVRPVALATARSCWSGPGGRCSAVVRQLASKGAPYRRRPLRRADDRTGRRNPGGRVQLPLGDPETQAVLRWSPAPHPLFRSHCGWPAADAGWESGPGAAVTTVLAARGIRPGRKPERSSRFPTIFPPPVTVFHAGTTRHTRWKPAWIGRRGLAVTAVAPNFVEAQHLSRGAARADHICGKQYRQDIGCGSARRS